MDVLVAGAGIAGLSAAIATAQAGHQVLIVERATELRELGAALSIWPNALAALDFLGVGDMVRSASLEAPTAVIRASSGQPIVRFSNDAMRTAIGGLPVVVTRAGLQAVLLEECARLGIDIRTAEAVKDVRAEGSRVTVTTSSGRSPCDALIGADGINSKVRTAVTLGDGLRDCDRVAWRALIPNREGLVTDTWLTVGVGLQLIASPAPEGLVYWAADTPETDMPADDSTDSRNILRSHFGSWHDPIPTIIEATPPDALIVNRIFDRRPPRSLHRGAIVLVGDAAHAMTPDLGQGACQAIEDAAVLLATARVRPGTDAAAWFDSFERVRLGRVRRMVRDSHAIGQLAVTRSRLGARARDVVTRLTPESLTNRRLAAYSSVDAFDRQLALAGASPSSP